MIHMSHTIRSQHQQATANFQPPKRGRGRPQAFTRKRQRFDAWNAFVQLSKPVRDGAEAAVVIRSGDHLRELGSRWRAMSAADREQYKSLAANQQVALQLTPGHDAEGSSKCAAPLLVDLHTAWVLGTSDSAMPLTPFAALRPRCHE